MDPSAILALIDEIGGFAVLARESAKRYANAGMAGQAAWYDGRACAFDAVVGWLRNDLDHADALAATANMQGT